MFALSGSLCVEGVLNCCLVNETSVCVLEPCTAKSMRRHMERVYGTF